MTNTTADFVWDSVDTSPYRMQGGFRGYKVRPRNMLYLSRDFVRIITTVFLSITLYKLVITLLRKWRVYWLKYFKHQRQRAQAIYMPLKSIIMNNERTWNKIKQLYNRDITWQLYNGNVKLQVAHYKTIKDNTFSCIELLSSLINNCRNWTVYSKCNGNRIIPLKFPIHDL